MIADELEVAGAYRRQREDPGHRGGLDRDMRDELGEQARVELLATVPERSDSVRSITITPGSIRGRRGAG